MRKKRKNMFSNKIGRRIVGFFLALFGGIGLLLILLNSNSSADYSSSFIVCLTILIVGLILFVCSFPSILGKIGENKVSSILQRIAKKYDGYLINDVIIPDEDGGKTCQIDHILFTIYRVFVIETKNYSGYIYGNDNQKEWTQVLAYGKKKYKFYNPVKQNAAHCCKLKRIINNDNIYLESVVVFTKNNKGNIDSSFVCNLKKLKNIIPNDIDIYTKEEILHAFNNVNYYKENEVCSEKEHIKEIKENQKNIDNLICPRCGGNLVLRTSKNGEQFYGCSNYPRCKFTKKV